MAVRLSGRLGLGLNCDTEQTLDLLERISGLKEGKRINLSFQDIDFFYPSFLVSFMIACDKATKEKQCTVSITDWPEEPEVRCYLRDSGFCQLASLPEPPQVENIEHDKENILPIEHLEMVGPTFGADLVALLERRIDLSTGVNRQLEECIEELRANIIQHSQTKWSGVALGQDYPASGRVRFSIGDAGIGIKTHLCEQHSQYRELSTTDVLRKSLEQGVSGTDLETNSGQGLYELQQFVELNGGELVILSEDGFLLLEGRQVKEKRLLKWKFQGTIVCLTFEADYGSKYYLRSELEQNGIIPTNTEAGDQ